MPLKILIVDDNLPALELVVEILVSLGVEAHPVGDSQQAVSLVDQEKFDGIILDLVMPKVDGFELIRRIRHSRLNERTPIIVITGLEDKQTLGRVFAAGATFFLQKPLDRNKLIYMFNSTRGSMLQERRRFKRVPLRTEVTCQIGSQRITGMSCKVSQSGILIEAENPFKVGNRVELSFHLPGRTKPIRAKGVVANIDEQQRMGIGFTYISRTDRQHIQDFVAKIEKQEEEDAFLKC